MRKLVLLAVVVAALLAGAVFTAFKVSPWPSVLLIRHAFDKGALAASDALARHVPPTVAEVLDQQYDASGPDAFLNVYMPMDARLAGRALPVIVWVHGGGFISGRKEDVANYLKILAARGFATVAVGYSIAPEANYPTPLRQVNAALGFLAENAARLNIDPERIFLAGDSAGAQIAGQLSNILSNPAYASEMGITPAIARPQLRGAILHCGPHGTDGINFDGAFGGFLTTALWSYFGTKDFRGNRRLQQFSVTANMTAAFPPIFVSAGNADPLAPLSYELAEKAKALGVPVDTLFYSPGHQPPLGHEYQFNLDGEDGRTALERTVAFINANL